MPDLVGIPPQIAAIPPKIATSVLNTKVNLNIDTVLEASRMETSINSGPKSLDIGTMNLVMACLNGDNHVITKSLRNMFLELDVEHIGSLDLKPINHTFIDDKLYILSDDAFNYGNVFGLPVSRPMSDGLISSKEIDSIDVLTAMVKSLIGQGNGESCVYSIPANPIDVNGNVLFHEKVFERIISELGYKPQSLNEAVAIVYSEAAETNFTALAISFGAGMVNVAIVYKSIPVVTFSISRGGDWVDSQVSISTSAVQNRVTKIKETQLDLTQIQNHKDKKVKRILESLNHYYKSLISYTFKKIMDEISKSNVELPDEVPLIISGGTSKAKGFLEIVSDIVTDFNFPFEISDVRYATDPLTAVAEGCLVKALRVNSTK